MIAALLGVGASFAITIAIVGEILRDRRRARRECQAWFDQHVGLPGEIREWKGLQ